MEYFQDNFVKKETKGAFSLWINEPYYKVRKCSSGNYYNKITNECCGNIGRNRVILYDDKFQLLSEPIFLDEVEWRRE